MHGKTLNVRLFQILGISGVFIASLIIMLEILMERVESGRGAMKDEWHELDMSLDLARSAHELHGIVVDSISTGIPQARERYDSGRAEFVHRLDKLQRFQEEQNESGHEYPSGESDALRTIEADFRAADARFGELAGRSVEGVDARELAPMFQRLETGVGLFAKAAGDEMDDAIGEIRSAEKSFDDVLVLVVVGLIGLMATILAFFGVYVIRPIQRLHGQVRRLTSGDFRPSIDLTCEGEIGDLASGINRMAGELREYTSRMETELHRQQKLAGVGRLAAGVAHEVNNPLASIAACCEGLLRKAENGGMATLDNEDLDDLRQIRSEVYRCKEITSKLLDLTRRRPIRLEPADLTSLARETLGLMDRQLAQKGIEADVTGEPVFVVADTHQIRQVLLNLVLNSMEAIEAADAGAGRIEVDEIFDENPEFAGLRITDNGVGIPPADIDHIFEPFFTGRADGGGTGLGLALSYAIVRSHGGRLRVSSGGRGRGAAFEILLPAAGVAREEIERTEPAHARA